MKKATVCIVGGLGNQLHCYAFGRAVAAQNEAILEVDAESGYWNDPYKRQYLLDAFPLVSINRKKMPKNRIAQLMFKAKIRLGIALSNKCPLSLRPIVCEGYPQRYQEDVHRTKYKSNPYFLGCWATYRYYQDIAGELRDELLPPKPDDPLALRILDKIESVRSCSIHWRSYSEEVGVSHPSLTEYYRSAMEIMENKYPDVRFFVFSDDQSAAKEELDSLGGNVIFADIPAAKGNAQSLIDFYLMYSCDHAIIGDSTFSWWAAWLSDSEAKNIVAPRGLSPWGDDWIPPHWTTVNIEPENGGGV
ncbi:MAG: alpha-1,2-fucosyltransferase [Pseudomonadota bacterium]